MSQSFAISGIHLGEHSFSPENLLQELEARGGDKLSFITIRTREEQVPAQCFYDWAQYFRDHKIYFMFLYTQQHAPKGKPSQFTPEMIAKINEIAGPYFLGDQLGETGSLYLAKPKGYLGETMPQDRRDMQHARDTYVDIFSRMVKLDHDLGIQYAVPVEATAAIKYTFDGGCDIALLEMMPGDPEFLVSTTRGCSIANNCKLWGTYIAHEWYGGLRNDDPLKYRRLPVAYNYAYLSGSHIVCLESGDEAIESFGDRYEHDHPFCVAYQKAVADYEHLIRTCPRPAEEPLAKVAFVHGNLDGYTGWEGNDLWCQHDREEWGMGAPEYSWRILDEVYRSRSWTDVATYGETDLSASPAYGLYDVIPGDCSYEALSRYDYVIFTGWHTMTDEIYENLRRYVENGGHLLISAAHMSTNPARGGAYTPVLDGKWSELVGAELVGRQRINSGVKFTRDASIPGVLYPIIKNRVCDPLSGAGFADYGVFNLTTATPVAVFHDSFDAYPDDAIPAVLENTYGKGTVTMLTSMDYPGAGAVYPLYRLIVREWLTASHRNCDIHVHSSDKLRYSVYRAEDHDMICLLNTDFDNPITARITKNGITHACTIAPTEMELLNI